MNSIYCIVLLHVQKNVPSTNFVKYFCLHILPKVNTDDDGKDVDELLQLLAEMVCFCADQGISNKCMANVYDVLIVRILSILAISFHASVVRIVSRE